jgi:hypothetical protein
MDEVVDNLNPRMSRAIAVRRCQAALSTAFV